MAKGGARTGRGSHWAGLTVCPAPPSDFPAPVLTLSQLEVSEGNQVTVNCEAHGGAQVVRLSGAPPGPPTAQVQFTLNASPEDHKRRFFCSAVLEVAGNLLSKNQTVELHVLCE